MYDELASFFIIGDFLISITKCRYSSAIERIIVGGVGAGVGRSSI